jgi:hypothetical protein
VGLIVAGMCRFSGGMCGLIVAGCVGLLWRGVWAYSG